MSIGAMSPEMVCIPGSLKRNFLHFEGSILVFLTQAPRDAGTAGSQTFKFRPDPDPK